MENALDIHAQAGPLAVTLGYVGLYYGFQLYVLKVKNALFKEYADKGEKFDRYFGQDRRMLAADRIQLNMLEHMPVFLTLLWLNAVFVEGPGTTIAGGAYVGARLLYPFLMGSRLGRGIKAKIMVSTALGYAVLGYFAAQLIRGLVAG